MIDAPACIASVHDGDSIRLCHGERIRIAGIDAPELRGSPRCSPKRRKQLASSPNKPWCDHAAGIRARDALRRILAQGPVRIERQGYDIYGRTLARLTVNGRDVGGLMVSLGMAREWRRR